MSSTDAAPRSGAEPANVVGDFDQGHGHALEHPAGLDARIERTLGGKVIGRLAQFQPGFGGDAADSPARELRVGVDAGAYRSAAERQFAETGLDFSQAGAGLFDLAGIAAELLAEANRSGTCEARAPDFEHRVELPGLLHQRGMEFKCCPYRSICYAFCKACFAVDWFARGRFEGDSCCLIAA